MRIVHKKGVFAVKTPHGTAELLYAMVGSSTMSIYHTFTPEEDRGKGIAEKLAEAAFEHAKRENLKVRPDCPYIEHFIDKHREWKEQVAKSA